MTDPIAPLSEALKDRYRLERELGRGGMATVWLAHDLRHDRPVALKVLRPQLAAALGAERFQREIRLAARLQHPHILSVFDSGETEGLLWFTMPYVRGESLRDRLARDGRLSVDEAFRITREAAQALQYAHGEGIIHRDVKPENILLTEDGSTLVADFGIARHVDGGGSTPRLTETGLAIGTPAYMSPEQAMGERTTDARTDQYALATVCWELLAGALPFSGPTPAAVIASRLTSAAPSVRTARADVTESQDQVIRRALATRADERFATIGDFARALRIENTPSAATAAVPVARASRRRVALLLAVFAGVLLAGGGLFATRRPHSPVSIADGDRRLAVLPFANLGDTADAYFADGVTDAVRGKLTAMADLTVIATASSNEYRASPKTPAQIARELGVRYLLTGRVRWAKGGAADRVQVSPELVEITADGTPASRWQQPFDATLTDVFAVQGDIAGKVAEQLGVALGGGVQAELAAQPTRNLAAYDAYLRGRAVRNEFTIQGVREGIRLFGVATALDSTFGEAWAALSQKLTLSYLLISPDTAVARQAVDAAERADRYAPGNITAILARTAFAMVVHNDGDEGLAIITKGLKNAPNSAEIAVFHAITLREVGRRQESIAEFERARTLDPRSSQVTEELAHTLVMDRRFAEAEHEADRGLALDSSNLRMMQYKAMAHLGTGDLDGARRITQQAATLTNPIDAAVHFATYGDLYWVLDEPAQRLLTTLGDAPFGGDPVNRTIVLAQLHALWGDHARSRVYADSSAAMFAAQVRAAPRDGERTSLLGLALALAGRRDSAARMGARGAQLSHGFRAWYPRQVLARIHVLNGDRQAALDDLEQLLTIPCWVSGASLAVDPNYASLRGEPRFQRLLAPR